MGRVIADMCQERGVHQVVCGFDATANDTLGFPVYTNLEDVTEDVDVLIDFTAPGTLDTLSGFLRARKIPAVICTTGYSPEQEEAVRQLATEVPIVRSGNMSVGVNAILEVVEELSKALKGFDIEVIEKHHTRKKDSPSGTAKMLYQAANRGRDNAMNEIHGRSGNDLVRPADEVGIHAIRAGNIVGEHIVLFAGTDEVIEVTHRASSRKIFGNGALAAAEFVVNQEPGFYTMADVLK